ncbi:hypothetical protein [Longibacter salinarum]|uniref:hypothetical protein n=1 Tax=Longibacter salinarum TaxID=1850348 RepID=UPI0015CF551E|nr:hypothetical protein [Longibacter salinarum]
MTILESPPAAGRRYGHCDDLLVPSEKVERLDTQVNREHLAVSKQSEDEQNPRL